jgi:Gnt-I system high-affinity gluconate transporter
MGIGVTGFIIGIPLFYNVGFVLVIPLIFSVAYQLKLPIVYTAVPMLSALSVTHGFLPPHPSPTALVAQFNANISSTLFYGILISIPTVIIAGPLFANTLKNIKATGIIEPQEFQVREGRTPGLFTCIFTSILPVLLLAITTIALPYLQEGVFKDIVLFFSDSTMVMLISLITATFTLGLLQGRTIKKVMDIYADAVKDIAMMLLIISGAGALKQILIDSGVSNEIAVAAAGINIHPLILGWIIAASIRVCVGSSTVAGLTAAGIIAPLVIKTGVNANLMVLSVGAGSLLFSHVNDTGFWLFKEYLNLSIKDTIRSWSLMETIISVCGLLGVLVLQYFT